MPDPGLPGGDMSSCIERMQAERGLDEESAARLCQSLREEEQAENGNVDELWDAIQNGAGLVADVGVDLVSGVDTPAVDSKWVMLKADDDAHDYRVTVPILLDKQDDDEDDDEEEDPDRRIAYAAAMIPREPDKEGDVVPTATVERAAHDFLKSDGGIDTDHSLIDGEGEPVESWVLKEDRTFDLPSGSTETYPEGTWMLGVEWGADAWARIQSGELTGLSIYGMADHVPLRRMAKQLDIPLADEAVVHLVYESRTAAEKASEEIGLGGAVHEHDLDGMTVFMPGESHEEFVDTYTEIAASADGDTPNTLKASDGRQEDMAEATDGDGGGGTDDPAFTEKQEQRLRELVRQEDDDEDEEEEEEKQETPQEAAAELAAEYDMDTGDVFDVLDAAKGADPVAVVEAIESIGAETEASADSDGEGATETEKRTDDANLSKGADGTATAATAHTGDADGGGSDPLSWSGAKERAQEGE